MGNTLTNYIDDDLTREALEKAGSVRTLHEIYGLFYGSLAAPDPADPARQVPVIFGDDSQASEEDEEDANDNLTSLWNFIARWKPEEEAFYFPEEEYPANCEGLLQHLTDDLALVHYFIVGLTMGGTEEDDFSEDAAIAMHELTEASERLEKNITVCSELDPIAEDDDPASTEAMLEDVEDTIADGIARVTIGLKHAKRNL